MVQALYKSDKVTKKRVNYTGTDTIKAGYALCYDRDDGTAADVDVNRTIKVEKPKSGNLHNFAGVVSEGPDFTGPGFIHMDELAGHVMDVYTDQNCTQETTLLTVKAGSYFFGAVGEGRIVAKAIQTVDRSTTNGLVQAITWYRSPLVLPYGTAAGIGPSPLIWESCPWEEIGSNPQLGYRLFDDFIAAPVMVSATANGPYLSYQDTGVTIAALETSDEVGGVVEVANNDGDNDEGHLGLGSDANFNVMKIASSGGKPCWFEARLKKAGVGNNGVAMFIGVGEEGFIGANGLVDNTGEVADKDHVGAQVLNADGDSLVPVYRKSGQTKQSGTAVAILADTYFKVGFVFDGSTLTTCVDGVSKQSVTDVSAATFPDGEEMTLILLTKVGAAAEVAVQMNWWRFAQLR